MKSFGSIFGLLSQAAKKVFTVVKLVCVAVAKTSLDLIAIPGLSEFLDGIFGYEDLVPSSSESVASDSEPKVSSNAGSVNPPEAQDPTAEGGNASSDQSSNKSVSSSSELKVPSDAGSLDLTGIQDPTAEGGNASSDQSSNKSVSSSSELKVPSDAGSLDLTGIQDPTAEGGNASSDQSSNKSVSSSSELKVPSDAGIQDPTAEGSNELRIQACDALEASIEKAGPEPDSKSNVPTSIEFTRNEPQGLTFKSRRALRRADSGKLISEFKTQNEVSQALPLVEELAIGEDMIELGSTEVLVAAEWESISSTESLIGLNWEDIDPTPNVMTWDNSLLESDIQEQAIVPSNKEN